MRPRQFTAGPMATNAPMSVVKSNERNSNWKSSDLKPLMDCDPPPQQQLKVVKQTEKENPSELIIGPSPLSLVDCFA